jgi:hypothetical protein
MDMRADSGLIRLAPTAFPLVRMGRVSKTVQKPAMAQATVRRPQDHPQV